jgi:D-tyrosyl-tRNA(Tyr) deacylase
MKVVVQRVSRASVSVDGQAVSSIGKGYLVLIGIGMEDTEKQADVLAEKLVKLRVLSDAKGKMNLSIQNVDGEMLVVSQFTLYAEMSGNRPSFLTAARPERAEPLYRYLIGRLERLGIKVQQGVFGADMELDVRLDGPVTILMEV